MKRTTIKYGMLLILWGLISACEGSQAKTDGGNADGNKGFDSEGSQAEPDGGDDDGNKGFDSEGNPGQPPIAERPIVGSYVCSIGRDRTSHAPRAWTGLSALQPLADGSVYLARVEWDGARYYSAPHSFVVSSFALDGALGSPTTVPVDDADAVADLATAPQGQGFVLVWADAQVIRFASLDAKGTLVGQPKVITALDQDADYPVRLQMAAGVSGSGFALAVSTRKNNVLEAYALFLDSEGVALGPVQRLGRPSNNTNSYYDPAPYVTATSDGYAFLWNDLDGKSGRIFFARTDALGNETVAPRIVTSTQDDTVLLGGTGFAAGAARIVEIAGGFVAAWSESHKGEIEDGGFSPSKGAWSVVRLSRLDSQGTPTGISATMRAPENDVDEVEPVLTPFEGALAVAWSRGSHIYICGGCVPDHRIDFVLIDPSTFAPLGNVVTVTNGGGNRAGGLLQKQVAVTGSSFLTLYDRTFHTSAEPGSAVFTCAH
jgi:hypothetical protein